MQRYNMFNQVHKGLRALLYDTAIRLQHADFWNVEEAAVVISRLREVISLFDKHARSEDNFVFTAVKRYEPSVADLFEQEHVKDQQLGEALAAALIAYEAASVITAKAWIAPKIHKAFNDFMVFNLEHMGKEEDILCPILWRYYADEELFDINCQMASQAPAPAMARMNKWMLRGLNTGEVTGWLKQVESKAPELVYQSLLAVAENELNEQRFRQVTKGLREGVVAA